MSGRTTHRHGVVPWYVPEGAEFDLSVEHGPRQPAIVRFGRGNSSDPWYRSPWVYTTLEDVGVDPYDDTVEWDEVEDFDDRTPRRPTVPNLLSEFNSLCELVGIALPPLEEEEPAPAPVQHAPVGRPLIMTDEKLVAKMKQNAKIRNARKRRREMEAEVANRQARAEAERLQVDEYEPIDLGELLTAEPEVETPEPEPIADDVYLPELAGLENRPLTDRIKAAWG